MPLHRRGMSTCRWDVSSLLSPSAGGACAGFACAMRQAHKVRGDEVVKVMKPRAWVLGGDQRQRWRDRAGLDMTRSCWVRWRGSLGRECREWFFPALSSRSLSRHSEALARTSVVGARKAEAKWRCDVDRQAGAIARRRTTARPTAPARAAAATARCSRRSGTRPRTPSGGVSRSSRTLQVSATDKQVPSSLSHILRSEDHSRAGRPADRSDARAASSLLLPRHWPAPPPVLLLTWLLALQPLCLSHSFQLASATRSPQRQRKQPRPQQRLHLSLPHRCRRRRRHRPRLQ